MSLLICIDGGGTYTRCMILDDKESVYEASVKKGSNYKKNENAFEVLERCMGEMLNFLDVYKANEDKEPIIIAGIAGIDTEEEYHL
ncbi:MAG: hypothetical protein JXO44_09990, partial [Clostridia bacterium]|nr:hypothetical protein [Clostridia bacterium]